MKKEWFASWFDSPYYHTLYKNHDDDDAKIAIDALLQALDLPPGARLLDLACGKGRHARYLSEKGFEVCGLDISEASVMFARQFENERLTFFQHDMRQPFRVNYFDAVLNFFTSFGYFDTDDEHLLALKNIWKNLKPGGLLLLDFFNAGFVRNSLIHKQIKEVDGIRFTLSKTIRGGYIFKSVNFETGGKKFHFQEKVRLFERADFQKLFASAGLQLQATFGDYDLSPFDSGRSKRLILIAKKSAQPAA